MADVLSWTLMFLLALALYFLARGIPEVLRYHPSGEWYPVVLVIMAVSGFSIGAFALKGEYGISLGLMPVFLLMEYAGNRVLRDTEIFRARALNSTN